MTDKEELADMLVSSVPLMIDRVSMSGGQLVIEGPGWFFGTALSPFRVIDAKGRLLFTDLEWEIDTAEGADVTPVSALYNQSVVEVRPKFRHGVYDIEFRLANGVRILVFDTTYPDSFLMSIGGLVW